MYLPYLNFQTPYSNYRSRMKSILLINAKIPTAVGILAFMSRINAKSELKQEISLFFSILFLEAVEISCLVELSMKEVL